MTRNRITCAGIVGNARKELLREFRLWRRAEASDSENKLGQARKLVELLTARLMDSSHGSPSPLCTQWIDTWSSRGLLVDSLIAGKDRRWICDLLSPTVIVLPAPAALRASKTTAAVLRDRRRDVGQHERRMFHQTVRTTIELAKGYGEFAILIVILPVAVSPSDDEICTQPLRIDSDEKRRAVTLDASV